METINQQQVTGVGGYKAKLFRYLTFITAVNYITFITQLKVSSFPDQTWNEKKLPH